MTLLWLPIFYLQNVIDAKTVVTFKEYVLFTSCLQCFTSRPDRCMWMCMLLIPWPCVMPILAPRDSPSLSTIVLRTWSIISRKMLNFIVNILFFCCHSNMHTFLILSIQCLKMSHLKAPMMQ